MAKIYTAQEMREEAKCFELRGGSGRIPAMLRQAADLMEREEKREKKYEYGLAYKNGSKYSIMKGYRYNTYDDAKSDINRFVGNTANMIVARREIGKWEEVSNG